MNKFWKHAEEFLLTDHGSPNNNLGLHIGGLREENPFHSLYKTHIRPHFYRSLSDWIFLLCSRLFKGFAEISEKGIWILKDFWFREAFSFWFELVNFLISLTFMYGMCVFFACIREFWTNPLSLIRN